MLKFQVIFLLIALVNASSQLHEQETNKQELNPANDVETIDIEKQQKKRTLLGVGPYAYAAKHVGVHPLGFKYILGYGPIGYTPYARPVTLLRPLLHTHGWKSVIPVHAVHSIKPYHVKPVVPIVPVPHFKPAHHHPHVHVHHHQPPVHPHVHPVVPVQPDEPHHHHHVHPVHPHVHPVQPAQPEEPIDHHVHTIQPVQPVQPVLPVQPVQPIVPVEKPVVPATIVPNIIKPVLQPQLPQLPYGYPFFKPLAIPNQIYPVQPSVVQQYVPQLHFQPPVAQPLPQPPNVQSLLPPNPLVHPYVPQVQFQPPVVHAVPQPPPVVQHLLPQPPPVQHLLPQPPPVQHLLPQPPPVVQHLLPQPPPVQHLLPQPPPVQPLIPQPAPVQPFVPQPPQHLLPQLPPQPSIFHIFKQFPFFKHVTPLSPVHPSAQGPAPDLPQAPVPPVTVHSPSNTHDSGVSVQIPLHLPEHPNFRPGGNIIPQFPAQPDSSDQDGHGQVPINQPDFHHEQGGHADNPFIIPQPQPHFPTTHPSPQTPLYLPPHPLLRPGHANPGDSSNSVQTEFSSTFPRHQFVGQGEIHHPSISLEPPYGPEHNLG